MIRKFRNYVFGPPFPTTAVVTLSNAQILALPTTPIALIAAPGTGYRIKIFTVSLRANLVAGYTNINGTFAELNIKVPNQPLALSITNDTTLTVDLLNFNVFFAGATDRVVDLTSPTISSVSSGSTTGTLEYVRPLIIDRVDVDNDAVSVAIDNNGSGNLTGGNAANTLKITTYYVIEQL